MMNQKVVIAGILVLVIGGLVWMIGNITSVSRTNNNQEASQGNSALPTRVPGTKNPTSVPTLIPPERSTGVKDEELPPATLNLSKALTDLRAKLPLKTKEFAIVFDYEAYSFAVTLQEPKQQNRIIFAQWLQLNYPSIPLERFGKLQ